MNNISDGHFLEVLELQIYLSKVVEEQWIDFSKHKQINLALVEAGARKRGDDLEDKLHCMGVPIVEQWPASLNYYILQILPGIAYCVRPQVCVHFILFCILVCLDRI